METSPASALPSQGPPGPSPVGDTGPQMTGGSGSAGTTATTPFVPSSLVEVDLECDEVRMEVTQLVLSWLQRQGYDATAQLLCDEAGGRLRQEYHQRKTLRNISRAIDEQNWDAALAQLKKLESHAVKANVANSLSITALTKSLPFLLAQQQYLELVDEDSGQRAYTFFLRRIKTFESNISKAHFQQLAYMLSCRSVGEAGLVFPEWRGWSAMIGRAQLLALISKTLGPSDTNPYCRRTSVPLAGAGGVACVPAPPRAERDLEGFITNALSYELLSSVHPGVTQHVHRQRVCSVMRPIAEQLPPTSLLLTLDTKTIPWSSHLCANSEAGGHGAAKGPSGASGSPSKPPSAPAPQRVSIKACQPFLRVPAVAIGTERGDVLWVPLGLPTCGSGGTGVCAKLCAGACGGPPGGTRAGEDGELWQVLSAHGNAHGVAGPGATLTGRSCGETKREPVEVMVPLYQHGSSVRSLDGHGRLLLALAGGSAVVMDTSILTCEFLSRLRASVGGTHDGAAQLAGVPECIQHYFSHSTEVYAGRFFPCGTLVLTGCSDGTITVWDLKSCCTLLQHRFSRSAIVATAVSPMGTMYYAASKDGVVRVVDVASGVLVHAFAPPMTAEISSICLAPTAATLLVSYRNGVMRLWDTLTAELLPRRLIGFQNNTRSTSSICFAGRSSIIASTSEDGFLCVWELGGCPSALRGGGGSRLDDGACQQRFLVSTAPTRSGVAGGDAPRRDGAAPAFLPARPVGGSRDPLSTLGLGDVGGQESRHIWTAAEQVEATTRLRLHYSAITDAKFEGGFLVTCGDDGLLNICGHVARL